MHRGTYWPCGRPPYKLSRGQRNSFILFVVVGYLDSSGINSLEVYMSSKVTPVDSEMPFKAAKKRRKQTIPKAVKEQLWLRDMGKEFQGKCMTSWCKNIISLFDFQCGHNIPESKGGKTTLENLVPICSRCNTSMGNQYTFTEWSKMHQSEIVKRKWWQGLFSCFSAPTQA